MSAAAQPTGVDRYRLMVAAIVCPRCSSKGETRRVQCSTGHVWCTRCGHQWQTDPRTMTALELVAMGIRK